MADLDRSRAAALEAFLATARKSGHDVFPLGGGRVSRPDVIPTGILTLDVALGVGGMPLGRVVEVYGAEGGGKTSLALRVIAEAQQREHPVAFIDAEHALDPSFAVKLGVDIERLYLNQPDSGDQALELLDRMLEAKAFGVIVIDSVASLVPQSELDGNITDTHVSPQARMMSQAMRRVVRKANTSGTLVIFINQTRTAVGKMFGDPTVTPGGKALKFYASLRLSVSAPDGQRIKDGTAFVGNQITARVKKNKLAAPFREAQYRLFYETGIDTVEPVRDAALAAGIIETRGGSHVEVATGERLAGSKREFVDLLRTDDELVERLRRAVLNGLFDETDEAEAAAGEVAG